jgi:hypothetical protein
MYDCLVPLPNFETGYAVRRFWVQNIFDVVQIVAFPQVNSPKVFIAIWFANSFGNFAFLGKNSGISYPGDFRRRKNAYSALASFCFGDGNTEFLFNDVRRTAAGNSEFRVFASANPPRKCTLT